MHSHISLFYHRFIFRRIYGLYKDIHLLFFIGLDENQTINKELHREMKEYKDIVLFNFVCNYFKLCMLTYNFLLWIKEYQQFYDTIIKLDTDTFLNIKLVKIILNRMLKLNKTFVLGKIWHINNKSNMYPSGMPYAFSSKSINILVANLEEKINKIKCSFEEDMLFGHLARESNFTFFDSFLYFNYISFKQIPNNKFNLNETYMIHKLRVSEIAFLNLIIQRDHSYLNILNSSCSLHN